MRTAALFLTSLASLQLGSGFVNVQPSCSTPSTPLCAATIDDLSLKEKFSALKGQLPENKDVVKCGGYYNLQQLCGNPKEELVKTIIDGIKSSDKKVTTANDDEKIEALATLLYAAGKGFEADLVDGEWAEVLAKQGTKSSRFQKAAEKGESKGFPINTFNIRSMTFEVGVKVLKRGRVYSKVKYSPLTDAYSKTKDGKIVLRRIGCDIVKASFKYWKLPSLSLFFLKRKGGFLEFVYMDKDIRITRGNRGGLFVHFRPEFLEAQLAQ